MSCVASSSPPEAALWVQNGGFLLIMVGVSVMFWGMAFICEEYCVPAITVFCKRNNFSDDVAGSIFIGTGLSLPVLFASFVGLFVENSSIGVGTVVGGNIFNQLVNICVGIHAAPDKTMKIDKVIFARETLFYILSCILVMWASESNLNKSFEEAFSRKQWEKCLSIHMGAALCLVGNYVLYCLVEIYFQSIYDACALNFRRWKLQLIPGSEVTFTGSLQDNDGRSSPPLDGDANLQGTSAGDEEAGITSSTVGEVRRRNFSNADGTKNQLVSPIIRAHDTMSLLQEINSNENASATEDEYNAELAGIDLRFMHNDDNIEESIGHVVYLPGLSESIQEVHEQQPARVDHLLEEFPMFMRSSFYETNGVGCIPSSRKWNLRYFTFNQYGLFYKLEFHLPMRGSHLRFLDVFDLEQVTVNNASLLEFSLTLRSSRKIYFFRASEVAVYDAVLRKLQTFLEEIKIRNDSELRAMSMKAVYEMLGAEDAVDPDSESVEDTMFIVPTDMPRKVFYYLTLPLKVLIYLTTPDVRKPGSEHKAILSTTIGFIWLAGITYVLIAGLNELANLLSISGAVLGMTVGAWAASYPAAWSTVVVARYGYGDMVVCNALGSNVFSNYLGLGLPWLVYTLAYQKPYSAIQDQGVVLSQLTLIFVALLVFSMIAWNQWVLQAWMIPAMMAIYVGYVAYFVYFMITL